MEKMICRQGMADTPQAWIYYKESGAGIPVLMLHGNAETHLIFDYYEKKLSMKYRVILMDSRAHGRSRIKPEYAESEFTTTDMARDAAALLDILHIPSCILFGFSYGAKKFDRLREAIKTSIIWSTSFCLVVGLVMAVFSTQIISQFTEEDTQMVLAGQKSLFANGITFILFGFYTVYSSLFLALGKGAAGFFLGACRQGVCFVPVILLLPMVWGMNGILYAQPIADVISVVITVFMALHLHRELSMAEKQIMSNSEI